MVLLLFSGRGQNYHEKTLLANSLVGKVDFCLTDHVSNMCRGFNFIANFYDEKTIETDSNVPVDPVDDDLLYEDMMTT